MMCIYNLSENQCKECGNMIWLSKDWNWCNRYYLENDTCPTETLVNTSTRWWYSSCSEHRV
jgi:hypothetical protein